MRLYLVPVSEVKQDDTWYCAGLRASGSNTSVLDNVFVPEHRSVSFSTLARRLFAGIEGQHQSDLPHAVHRGAQLRAARARCSARRAAAMPISCNGRSKRYLTYTQLNIAQHVPVQMQASPRSPREIDAAELLARRALATGARRIIPACRMETRTLLRRDFTYAMKHAARGHGRSGQDLRLQRLDGRQSGAALLARRARHLLARGDELGRAGGEFRPHGIRAARSIRPIRCIEQSFRARATVRPEVAGPMTGSAREPGIHNHGQRIWISR